jgi:hypothetical protein
MQIDESLSVLIIGYRRSSSIEMILEACLKSGVKKIYLALDGPKYNSPYVFRDQQKIRDTVSRFESKNKIEVKKRVLPRNVGISINILSGLDWIFSYESFVSVLEDDCLPSSDFFTFSRSCFDLLKSDPTIWLACGTQFAPTELAHDSWLISSYFSSWGWSTTRQNWRELRNAIIANSPINIFSGVPWEVKYWNEGGRRVQNGFNDAWDIVFNQQLRANEKFALTSAVPLVTNCGYDSLATNTTSASEWLNAIPGIYHLPQALPQLEPNMDNWIRRNVYKIHPRHLVSTEYTKIKDLLSVHKEKCETLLDRWFLEKTDF